MDNAGDWIYIVFLVVAAISGLFGSKNKKKRPTQVLGQPGGEMAEEQPTAPQKGFWDILQEMQNEPPQVPIPPKEQKIKKKNEKTKATKKPSPFLTSEKEMQQSAFASSAITGFAMEEEISALSDMEFNNAADLRKAVIYSEILNRKY